VHYPMSAKGPKADIETVHFTAGPLLYAKANIGLQSLPLRLT